MATINVSNLTYTGKEAQEIFSKQVYNADITKYGITLRDQVKGKEKLYTGELGSVWQKYTCPFTPKGEVSLAEAFIEPARIKVNIEECYDAFDGTYLVEQTKITLNGGIPQTFSDWFFNEQLLPKMAKEYQEIFWKGDTDSEVEYLSVTDGIEKKLKASNAQKITGSAFTVDNIVSQVEAAIAKGLETAAAEDVPTDEYKVFMNYSDVRLLETALGKIVGLNMTNTIFNNYAKQGDKLFVMGYEIVPTMQSRSSVIFGPVRNIVLGFDTFDSHLEYKLIDMRETTGDNTFRVIALSNIAVGLVLADLFTYSYKA